jgi:hypothetical protein
MAMSDEPDIKTDSLGEVAEILLEGLPLPPAGAERIRLNVTAIGHV